MQPLEHEEELNSSIKKDNDGQPIPVNPTGKDDLRRLDEFVNLAQLAAIKYLKTTRNQESFRIVINYS
jgi:hypothetical protein